MINKQKALYLLKKIDPKTKIEDVNEGIIFLDKIDNNEDNVLLIQIIENGRNNETKIIYFINDKPTIRKYKTQFWVYRNTIKHFTEDLLKFFNVESEDVEKVREDIFRVLNGAYDIWMNRNDEEKEEEPKEVLTEEEQTQVNDLLNNPNFFEIISQKMDLWCEGNEMQKVFLYVISFGTYLKNPPLIGIIGNSSSGKSHLVKSVMKMFKKDLWDALASSSSKGFYYDDTDWEGKRLFLLEIQGLNDENMVLLRTWWSEGNDMGLKHITVDKNAAGQMTGEAKTLKKPPFGIFTSAVPEVENQMSTRIWRVHADDSEAQHKRIKNMIAENAIFDIDLDMDKGIPMKIFHHVEDNLETDINVIVPYAHFIDLKDYKNSRVNRDMTKMYNAIKCFTLLSQKRRFMFECEGKKYLLSNYEDYENFVKYGGLIFNNTIKDIDDDMRRSINIFVEQLNHGIEEVSISSMARQLGINNRPKVKRILDELFNKNILAKHKGGRNAWVYSLTDDSKINFSGELSNVTTELQLKKSKLDIQESINMLIKELSCQKLEGYKGKKITMTFEELKKLILFYFPYSFPNLLQLKSQNELESKKEVTSEIISVGHEL